VLWVMPPIKLNALSGTWLRHDFPFDFDAASQTWYALIGVDLSSKAGAYPLTLSGESVTGPVKYETSLAVREQTYPVVTLTVMRKFTAPSKKQLLRIKREEARKHQAFAHSSAKRLWNGPFRVPVNTAVSEVFGVNRVFNGELQTRHQGVDYRAARGTRIVAANSGRVVLARPLFFEGKCVILDHGEGLFTLYMHFSRLRVKEGQKVARGQLLGLSGATGRVTGPHFHLSVRWEGSYLDPVKLLQLKLPVN